MPDSPSTPVPDHPVQSDDLGQVHELILASHADLVPELVKGESIADLVASIEPAKAAFSRIVESAPKPTPAVTIPAGGNMPVTLDIDTLPTSEKIRRGLAFSNRKD